MKIYLVRHGLSKGNIDKSEYFRNLDCDIELAERGKDDAINAADDIMSLVEHDAKSDNPPREPRCNFNLYHSSYKRAYQTANILHGRITGYQNYQINKFEELPLIREREWGNLRDIVEMGNKTESHFNFYYRPSGGESFADCYQRAVLFHQHILATSKYEHNIVVAHGEFNKLYLMYLLGWSVKDFERYKNPRNGEVFLIDTVTGLSGLTPLTTKN
jgi:broad specificity phosphatase PhoE